MNTVPVVISVVALLLSVASIYFQFFHKRDTATCTLVGYNVDKDQIIAQLVIGNDGSRPILLKDARLWLRFKSKTTGYMGQYDTVHRNIREPILIPKSELKSITLTMSVDDNLRNHIQSWHDSGHIDDYDGSWPIRSHLVFVTVSGKILNSDENIITVKWKHDGHSASGRDEFWRINSWKNNKFLKRLISDLKS